MGSASFEFDGLLETARELLSGFHTEEELVEANDCINQAICVRADSADAWLLKCQAMSALGDDAAALAAVDKTIVLQPDSAEAHYWRAAVLADMGRPVDALASLDDAQARLTAADQWLVEDLYCERAMALDAQGHADEALALFEEALRAYPDSAVLRANLEPLKRQKLRRSLTVLQGGR